MRRIILASKSKARQKLLRRIGLVFKAADSRVKESMSLRKGCRHLVVENALRKARDVSARFDSGIVIGADSLVLIGKRLIGKPKTLKEAHQTLKRVSRKPLWVYTGIAVIDIDNNKTYTDYEKTKVYMYPLSDANIKRYFRKVSPLDKAGAFDVEGVGSAFIDRIEGCFYNVVGLPLAKLGKLLEKAGISIL